MVEYLGLQNTCSSCKSFHISKYARPCKVLYKPYLNVYFLLLPTTFMVNPTLIKIRKRKIRSKVITQDLASLSIGS